MIRLYLIITEKFMCLIFWDGFWVVHIPFILILINIIIVTVVIIIIHLFSYLSNNLFIVYLLVLE